MDFDRGRNISAADVPDPSEHGIGEVVETMAERVGREFTSRMDREVRGAWRAGYDYLHVYDTLDCRDMRLDTFSVKRYVLPSNTRRPPRPDTASYKYTYVLDDEILRDAIGERVD